MSEHTITTEVCVKFSFPGLADGEHETAYPELAITYRYIPGRPAYTPRGEYAPIDPPEEPEVEFVSARVVNSDGLSPTAEQVNDWAEEWLSSDEGYNATAEAAATSGPDPDEAYERMRDDARDFDGF